MQSSLVRKKVAAIAAIVLTTGAWFTIAGSPSAFASTASPSALGCRPGTDYIDLHGTQIRSKVYTITNPKPGLQYGHVVCGEHVFKVERTKSGSTWQEWHTY